MLRIIYQLKLLIITYLFYLIVQLTPIFNRKPHLVLGEVIKMLAQPHSYGLSYCIFFCLM